MYEYKCVGAPEKAKRRRGAKTRTDRVAHALQDLINREAVDGWEYQRTDLLPVEERTGLFSRMHETHRAVLIFRRARPDTARSVMRRGAEAAEQSDPPIRLAADSETTRPSDPLSERIKR